MPRNLDFIGTDDVAPYKVYSTEFDRTAHIGELIDRDRLESVYGWMHKYRESRSGDFSPSVDQMISRLASQFEESGVDPSETAVTILVDGSGSTRGAPARDMTISTIETCIALETLGVETTVLGYTTSSWKGGRSRKKWLAEGRPRDPGRLCDLLHVVYKWPHESVGASIDHLCALACDETKKENVDGEALQWAAETALQGERAHRILVNVTDGVWPVDDSTLSVNPETLLLGHLKSVADEIEAEGRLALSAVYLDLTSHLWKSRFVDEFTALKDRGQSIFPRDVFVQVRDDFALMLGAVADGVAMGIERAAQLDQRISLRA